MSPIPLGALGILRVGDARVELFAVPSESDLYPLCAVFGATADAALLILSAAAAQTGGLDERRIAEEIGLPVAPVEGPLDARSLGAALRDALQQLNPHRQ